VPRRRAAPTRWVPALGWACAAALLLLVIGGVWREYGSRQGGTASSHVAAGRLLVSELITPGLTRGTAALPRISIPANVNTVQLHLEVSAITDPRNSELDLATRSGMNIWHGAPLEVHEQESHRILTVEIPASALASGEYELSVRTHQNTADPLVDYYYFEARRE